MNKWKPEGTKLKPHPVAIAYQNAWEKIKEYYGKTDVAHSIYDAIVLLYPEHRKRYFDVH
jgi:hypothetical protein